MSRPLRFLPRRQLARGSISRSLSTITSASNPLSVRTATPKIKQQLPLPQRNLTCPPRLHCFSTTSYTRLPAPQNHDRGPASKEDTQTDFSAMDVLGNTPPPATAIDTCYDDGFAFGSGVKVRGGGVMLVGGEVLRWNGQGALDKGGRFTVQGSGFGVLDVLWPKPDLLIIGTGEGIRRLAPETRKAVNELGIRVEVQDTRNAAAQYNLLATERGVGSVAAALVPMGWKG